MEILLRFVAAFALAASLSVLVFSILIYLKLALASLIFSSFSLPPTCISFCQPSVSGYSVSHSFVLLSHVLRSLFYMSLAVSPCLFFLLSLFLLSLFLLSLCLLFLMPRSPVVSPHLLDYLSCLWLLIPFLLYDQSYWQSYCESYSFSYILNRMVLPFKLSFVLLTIHLALYSSFSLFSAL